MKKFSLKVYESDQYEEEEDFEPVVFEANFPENFIGHRNNWENNADGTFSEFSSEDGGDALIATLGRDLNNNQGDVDADINFSVEIVSYDLNRNHDMMQQFLDKKVRITIEVI